MGDIAQYGSLAPDVDTALQWLCDIQKRWLLIIDNAQPTNYDIVVGNLLEEG